MDLSGTQTSPTGTASPAHLLERIERLLSRRWFPALVNFLVLVLLCFSLAQATWRLLAPSASDEVPTTRPEAGDNPGDFNLQTLLTTNLFGEIAETTKPAVSLDSIPLSSLSLVLTGVMVTPAGSFALISADGGPETPFSVDQEISANVTLYAVYADRVLIRRGSAIESLMLKDTTQNAGRGRVLPVVPTRARPRVPAVRRRSANNFTVDRQELTQQMQKPDFLRQAMMVPDASGGFLVREIQPGSIYQKLGLRVGDVIKTVNGQPVNSVEDVMRLYSQFSSASNIQVEVRRAGRNESLVYNLQ